MYLIKTEENRRYWVKTYKEDNDFINFFHSPKKDAPERWVRLRKNHILEITDVGEMKTDEVKKNEIENP